MMIQKALNYTTSMSLIDLITWHAFQSNTTAPKFVNYLRGDLEEAVFK